MTDVNRTLLPRVEKRLAGLLQSAVMQCGEVTIQIAPQHLREVCLVLRDESGFAFEILIDLCGVDYLTYADSTWQGDRFAVVYHLLSVKYNQRIRIKTFLQEDDLLIDSVSDIWASANWYEREAFDLFGILFAGHPDLRRLLTDYGFIGHPFRKDFPLIGNVEMRYDPEKQRVVYQPVSIEERINIPTVIRHDHRYVVTEEEGKADHG